MKEEISVTLANFEKIININTQHVDNYFSVLNEQIVEINKLRIQDLTESKVNIDSTNKSIVDCGRKIRSIDSFIEKIVHSISGFSECFRIQQALEFSNEQDKYSLGLYGVKETMSGDFGKSDFIMNQHQPHRTSVSVSDK